eukprot:g18984.t1
MRQCILQWFITGLDACVQKTGSQQLLTKEAEMINAVGEVILEAYVDLRVAWDSINKLMPLVLWFFANQEYQICVCVEPFLTEFFVKVKSFVKSEQKEMELAPCHSVSLEQVRPILMQTLQLIIQRTAYPAWFQHDPSYEDEEQHVAFLEFRKSLAKIYKRIFLVDEQLGLQFVQASITQLTQNLQGVQPMEVDAVLYLFKDRVQGCRGMGFVLISVKNGAASGCKALAASFPFPKQASVCRGNMCCCFACSHRFQAKHRICQEAGEIVKQLDQHLQAKGPLAGAFLQLLECEALVGADHGLVQLALMEIYVRYGKLLALHPDLFPRTELARNRFIADLPNSVEYKTKTSNARPKP